MPNCFTLTRKSDLKAGPVDFTIIDEEMCKHFKVLCDPVHWYWGWYNVIGLGLACGRSFNELKDRYQEHEEPYTAEQREYDTRLVEIVDWLDANFTSDAWYQHR